MPILAICPYCHEGKVRAPNSAVGLSADCPRCHNCFTLVPSTGRMPEPARPSTAVRPPAVQPPPVHRVQAPAPPLEKVAEETVKVSKRTPVPEPDATPDPAPLIEESPPVRTRNPALAPALVAVT